MSMIAVDPAETVVAPVVITAAVTAGIARMVAVVSGVAATERHRGIRNLCTMYDFCMLGGVFVWQL